MKMLSLTERITGGIPTSSRRAVERNRTLVARRSPETQRRPTQNFKSLSVGRNSLRASNRRSMEHATRRVALRQRCQLLAAPSRLDQTWSLGGSASAVATRQPLTFQRTRSERSGPLSAPERMLKTFTLATAIRGSTFGRATGMTTI